MTLSGSVGRLDNVMNELRSHLDSAYERIKAAKNNMKYVREAMTVFQSQQEELASKEAELNSETYDFKAWKVWR